MDDLIAELEQAQEGSRELSDGALLAAGWTRPERDHYLVNPWLSPIGEIVSYHKAPSPTEDLQDALGLVPEGRWYNIMYRSDHDITSAGLGNDPLVHIKGNQPARALTIACLKAIKEKAGE